MGVLLFGRTQDAWGTPFDNTDPNAILIGISSNTVQEAIIEVKQDAIDNDRYPFQAQYGGNANTGRYLEIFSGLASYPDAPFIFPENSRVRTVSIGRVGTSTVTFGFFRTTNLVTPVFSLSLAGQSRALFTGLTQNFFAGDELAIRVTAGSCNKPFLRVWVNTVT